MIAGDFAVLFAPASAWSKLAEEPATHHWLSRPLLLLAVFACAVSLTTAGLLTLRLALPAVLYASMIPLLQIGSLAVVSRGRIPLRRAADLFAIGNAPWMLLLLVFSATWSFVPPPIVYGDFGAIWKPAGAALLVWTAYVDWWFFRVVLGRTPVEAARDLAIQRLLCWGVGVAIFVGPSASQAVASLVGL